MKVWGVAIVIIVRLFVSMVIYTIILIDKKDIKISFCYIKIF